MSKRDESEMMSDNVNVLEDGSDTEDETSGISPSPKRQALVASDGAPTSIGAENNGVKKQKSQKRQKGEPKGKTTAYGFFSNEIRTHMKESNQVVAFTELSKQTAQLWRGMTEDQKAPYEQQAREDKDRWMKEMEIFKAGLPIDSQTTMTTNPDGTSTVEKIVKPASVTPGSSTKKQKVKVKKDKNAPKGPIGSFLFFYADVRAELLISSPEMENTEMGRVAGTRWKSLSPEEKAPYEQKAKEDKERHVRELAEYLATNPLAAQNAASGKTHSNGPSASNSAFSKAPAATLNQLKVWGIRRSIKSEVKDWDEHQFDDCNGDEVEAAKQAVFKVCREYDVGTGVHDTVVYKSRAGATKVLDEAMKAAIKTIAKDDDDDSDSDEEGASTRKKCPAPSVVKSEDQNKWTATVHRLLDPFGADMQTVGRSRIVFELLELDVKE
jgi:hypothetical protein